MKKLNIKFLIFKIFITCFICNINAKKYSINFMWINKSLKPEQEYIYPKNDLSNPFLQPIYNWAAKNPKANINIWFDCELTTKNAINKTNDLISTTQKIRLRDVRTIPIVKENLEVFSEKTPVYFRVDLLRVIAMLQILTQTNECEYAVYADLDMKSITKKEIFTENTKGLLKYDGIVLAQKKI